MFMFTCLSMAHLPNPPEVFIQRAHGLARRTDLPDSVEYMSTVEHRTRSVQRQGTIVQSRSQKGRDMGADWEQWVRENIVNDFLETGLRVSEPVSDTHGAHTDPQRKWKLYYLLERGGDDAVTCFYKEKDQPVVRDLDDMVVCNNMDELEVIDRVQWPMHQWVLLNTMIIHGVEGIQGYRTNFTVSIKPRDLRDLRDLYLPVKKKPT
jgi:hypothetical protein